MSIAKIQEGVWGHKESLFRAVHLTTRKGDDNSPEKFKKDFKALMQELRREMGYEIEHVGALGYTPKQHLLHYHGLFRIKGGIFLSTDKKQQRRMLGDLWNKHHNAFAVDIDKIRSLELITKYITKHILKDYMREEVKRGFILSRGWKNKELKEVLEDFKEFYIQGRGFPWMGEKGWKAWRKLSRIVCERKTAIVKFDFGYYVIRNGKIQYSEIYGG